MLIIAAVFVVTALVFAVVVAFDTSNRLPLLLILGLAMTQGVFEMALGIPTLATRLVMEAVISLLFLKALYRQLVLRRERFRAPGAAAMATVLIATVISYTLNGGSAVLAVLFARHVLIFYVFFLALMNLEWSPRTDRVLRRYIIVLVGLQLVAAVEKLFRRGIEEGGGIGTMSVQGGSLSTVFPLLVIGFLMASFLYRGHVKYLAWIPVFIAFGVLNSKRGLAFIVPVLLVFQYLVYRVSTAKHVSALRQVKPLRRRVGTFPALAGILLVAVGGVYGAVRALKSLNPESTIGGSFRIAYVVGVVLEYETSVMDLQESRAIGGQEELSFGRVASTLHTFVSLYAAGPATLLFGHGPGLLIDSRLTGTETSYANYVELGIAAGKTGLVWMLNQVGIVGAFALLAFYLTVLRRLLRLHRALEDPAEKAFALGMVGSIWVFLVDYLAYSTATLVTGAVTPIFYLLLAYEFKYLSPTSAHDDGRLPLTNRKGSRRIPAYSLTG